MNVVTTARPVRSGGESPAATIRSHLPWLIRSGVIGVGLSLVFLWVFRTQISVVFAYGGLRYREPDWAFVGLGVLMAWGLTFSIGPRVSNVGDFTLSCLLYMVGLPAVVIPHVIDIADRTTSLWLSILYFVVFLGLIKVAGMRSTPSLAARTWARPAQPQKGPVTPMVVMAAVGLVVATLGTMLWVNDVVGLSYTPTAFQQIYVERALYAERAAAGGGAMGYAIALQMKAVNPALIVLGMSRPGWFPLAVLGGTSQYVLFATTEAKQALFSIIVMIGLGLFLRFRPVLTQWVLGLAILGVCLVATLFDRLSGAVFWSEVVVDRFFLFPGFLPVQFYESFRDRSYNLWSDAFLSGFVADRTGSWTPDTIVGWDLTGHSGVFANASFLGDGFANMGILGILVEGVVLLGTIVAFSRASSRLPAHVSFPMVVMPVVSLANGSPITALLSGGVLPALLMLWVLSRDSQFALPERPTA